MSFGEALDHIKIGHKVTRKVWGDTGIFIYLVNSTTIPSSKLRNEAREHLESNDQDTIVINSHIDMKTNDGSVVIGWSPSQFEMLSEDWEVVL